LTARRPDSAGRRGVPRRPRRCACQCRPERDERTDDEPTAPTHRTPPTTQSLRLAEPAVCHDDARTLTTATKQQPHRPTSRRPHAHIRAHAGTAAETDARDRQARAITGKPTAATAVQATASAVPREPPSDATNLCRSQRDLHASALGGRVALENPPWRTIDVSAGADLGCRRKRRHGDPCEPQNEEEQYVDLRARECRRMRRAARPVPRYF
jgi:hypothetical protein